MSEEDESDLFMDAMKVAGGSLVAWLVWKLADALLGSALERRESR